MSDVSAGSEIVLGVGSVVRVSFVVCVEVGGDDEEDDDDFGRELRLHSHLPPKR